MAVFYRFAGALSPLEVGDGEASDLAMNIRALEGGACSRPPQIGSSFRLAPSSLLLSLFQLQIPGYPAIVARRRMSTIRAANNTAR